MRGTSDPASAGGPDGCVPTVCGTCVTEETRADCLQELARINKEIETVRHEVEQEQRRLSHYQTQESTKKVTELDTARRTLDGESCLSTRTYSRARKYVVDNSKPRTDLEYDPLSNFSAVLRSCSSEKKDINKDQGLKRPKDPVPCNQKMLSRPPCSEQIEDSNEEDVLIIDVPPSPEKKRSRSQKPVDCFDAFQNIEEELAVYTESVLLESPLMFASDASSAVGNKDPSDLHEDTGLGLTGCVKDQEAVHHNSCFQAAVTEVKSGPDPANLTTDNHCWNIVEVKGGDDLFQTDLPPRELPLGVEKIESLQPCDFSQTNSLFSNPPLANSPGQNGIDHRCPPQKMMPLLEPDKPLINQTSCPQYEEAAEPSVICGVNQPEPSQNQEVETCESSSEADVNYSDVELSDSDPMEECYRIFMEANHENERKEKSDLPAEGMDVDKPEANVKMQSLPVKKRVAHEAKHTECVGKSRPQPQVLVPLRGPEASGFASKASRIQQRASTVPASAKGGQLFVASTCQRKPETRTAPCPQILQPVHLHNPHMNYIPLGATVINMGNNLHLILPEGALPVASAPSPLTPLLTPISHVQTSTLAVKPAYFPPALTAVQRFRTAAPVLIPLPAREPAPTAASAPATNPQPPAAKPAVKRKLKHQQQQPPPCDAAKEKVPHDVRQRYVNMFTKEFIRTAANVNDAFEKALAEERSVYNRSVNKLKYLSIAVNALKRLKNQSVVATKDKTQVNMQKSKGNIQFNLKTFKDDDDATFCESLTDYILTEEKLIEANYPVQRPGKPGCATLSAETKKGSTDSLKRICCRCGATYSVNRAGKHIRKEECNYHYGKGVENRVPGGVETRYSCCEGVMGAPGCQVFKLHVHDSLSLEGFVSTVAAHPTDTRCPGVYALDCEMCYTIHGLELSRVTVVNSNLQVIYDTFVRPDDVIDYNTRFSGISEEDVKGNHTPLREVQQTLLSFISADTILIGHSLETDLCALKLLHGKVVDTSVVFPHRLGPPHKLTLNHLTAEYLRRIIQESVCGHDTAEDAAACMELMLWKVKEDGKFKK